MTALVFLTAVLAAEIPARHTITIETLQVEGAVGSQIVDILEIRGYDGYVIGAEKFSLAGNWQVANNGFSTSGNQASKLTYAFYAKNGKDVRVLIQKTPGGGQALFKVDAASKQVDFNGVRYHQVHTFTLHGVNRWVPYIWGLDFIVSIGLISILLFVVAVCTGVFIPKARSSIRWSAFPNDMVFLAALFILLLAPLYRYSGSITDFEDTFSFRTPLLRGWAEFRFRVLGDRLFNLFIVGKDNWLSYSGELSLDDYQNVLPVTDEDLAAFQSGLDGLNDRLQARGIRFLLVVVPNKNTIYPEYLPPQVPVLGKQSFLDRLVEYQGKHGKAQILDLRAALLEARRERQVFYTKDTHWNAYGAWVGYQEIMRALQKDFPSLRPHSLDEYAFVDDGMKNNSEGKSLGQTMILDQEFHLELKEEPAIKSWTTSGPKIRSIITTTRPGTGLPKLVMYRDSFGGWLIPFLSDHFSPAVYVWAFRIDEDYIQAEAPDIVVVEVTERYLTRFLKSLRNEPIEDTGGLFLDE